MRVVEMAESTGGRWKRLHAAAAAPVCRVPVEVPGAGKLVAVQPRSDVVGPGLAANVAVEPFALDFL